MRLLCSELISELWTHVALEHKKNNESLCSHYAIVHVKETTDVKDSEI